MTGAEDLRRAIPPGSRWRHYKGNRYEVIAIALHSETLEPTVIYRDLTDAGKVWARPASMWLETVPVGDETVPRFAREE